MPSYSNTGSGKGSEFCEASFLSFREKWLFKKQCCGISPSGCCLKTNCPPKNRTSYVFSQLIGLWMTFCCCFANTHSDVISNVCEVYLLPTCPTVERKGAKPIHVSIGSFNFKFLHGDVYNNVGRRKISGKGNSYLSFQKIHIVPFVRPSH